MGPASAYAVMVEEFDPTRSIVALAIGDTLALVADDSASLLAAGLDLKIEQLFLC